MNVGSLFSGIGGIDLGLERAGMRVVWQVECDPYARAVLRKHWPGVPCYEDVRTVTATDLAPVDLVCGGFPCQDISQAGKRTGIDGAQSGLWRQFARIVRDLRPRYVLIENVRALRSRGLNRVLADLAALGFDAEWDCLPAAAFGAPHRRWRLFIVAYAHRKPQRAQPRRRRGASRSDPLLASLAGAEGTAANADGVRQLQPERIFSDQWGRPGDCTWWSSEPDVERVVYGVPSGLDRIARLGNAALPQIAEWLGRLILAHAKRRRPPAAPPEGLG